MPFVRWIIAIIYIATNPLNTLAEVKFNAINRVKSTPFEALATHVSDADTLWVTTPEGARLKLRLLGIDAPEICQQGGKAASDQLKARVLRQRVRVESRARDDYGRALARVWLASEPQPDSANAINAWLVAQGLAWSDGQPGRGQYGAQERSARDRKLGVHAQVGAELPRDFRKRHGPCQRSNR